jgi:hypothetical protein
MSTPFVPTPFTAPVISPDVATLFRRTPYISPSEYKSAPTAVATNNLVVGGTAQQNLNELSNVIMRASSWVDTLCFHRAEGTLAASPSTESGWITPRQQGELSLQCNFKPILEVDAIAIGPGPGFMNSLDSSAVGYITTEGNIISLNAPWGGVAPFSPTTLYPSFSRRNGKIYCVWTYVNGYPHTYLAANATAGQSTITVGPSIPGQSIVYGVYPGSTQLVIHDDITGNETVTVSGVNGLTLSLASPLLYNHAILTAPDAVRVTAIPWIVEQACISLVSALIKLRGTRAAVIPNVQGTQSTKQALIQAGGQSDYQAAFDMLKPFKTVYVRNSSA